LGFNLNHQSGEYNDYEFSLIRMSTIRNAAPISSICRLKCKLNNHLSRGHERIDLRNGEINICIPTYLTVLMSLHYLAFRTLVHATESEEKVFEAMRSATSLEELSRTEVQGHHGNAIVILEGEIKRSREIDGFFKRMDGKALEEIIKSLDQRVDDDCHIYFRLDKQEAYQGRITLAEHEDFIQVRGTIRSYPKNRDSAISSFRKYLESFT
jgi:RNA binding exosome subunit